MTTSFHILDIRKRLGKEVWGIPEEFGPDGWSFDNLIEHGHIIITSDPEGYFGAPGEWWHASMSFRGRLPSYEEMDRLHRAVWPEGYAYQVAAPPSKHVNIHPNVLHLFGRADGANVLPDFAMFGTI
jgi:hypothetical protein